MAKNFVNPMKNINLTPRSMIPLVRQRDPYPDVSQKKKYIYILKEKGKEKIL